MGSARGDVFLPDLVIAADVMKGAAEMLEAEITKRGGQRRSLGKIVIGTVFGDLHDIGKAILGSMLNAHGFEVIDMGVNVSPAVFLDAVRQNWPQVLGMSSLLTITAEQLRHVIDALSVPACGKASRWSSAAAPWPRTMQRRSGPTVMDMMPSWGCGS